jgi:hypothetical protein
LQILNFQTSVPMNAHHHFIMCVQLCFPKQSEVLWCHMSHRQ